jgi:hypothetical protein
MRYHMPPRPWLILQLGCACRVVEKARQIADDQRKLATLMQDAAEAEARTPRSSSPGTLMYFVSQSRMCRQLPLISRACCQAEGTASRLAGILTCLWHLLYQQD